MGAKTIEKWNDVRTLTDELIVLPLDAEVAIQASIIYHDLLKANKMIEFRDIFIAATCLANQISLNTLNKKHFNRIKTLTLI